MFKIVRDSFHQGPSKTGRECNKFKQFHFGKQNLAKLSGRIVAASTILEIADLPIGYYASRKSKNDKWKVEKLKAK